VVMARIEAPIGAANVLIEPSPKTAREGQYTARTLVRVRPRVHVRIMNVTNQYQVLSDGTTIGQGEPITWVASLDSKVQQQWRPRGLSKEHKNMLFGAKPNL
jgi:hypothetical protein